jgi:hypothetical protein
VNDVCLTTATIQAAIIAGWMPNELNNIYDPARQRCRNSCLPRQTHIATLRTHSENRPPDFCTNRGDASDVTTPCLVFDAGKAPRFSLSSCRIGCIARDKGFKQSHRMGAGLSLFPRVSKSEQRLGGFGMTRLSTWGTGALRCILRAGR